MIGKEEVKASIPTFYIDKLITIVRWPTVELKTVRTFSKSQLEIQIIVENSSVGKKKKRICIQQQKSSFKKTQEPTIYTSREDMTNKSK